MNEQFIALEDQFETMEADFIETYVEYLDPHGLELDSEEYEEVHEEILDKSMDESVIYFEEVKDLELENAEYLDDSSPHPPPEEPVAVLMHTCRRELSPTHLVCPRRHNV